MKYLKYIILSLVIFIIITIIVILNIMNGKNYIIADEAEDINISVDIQKNVSIVDNRINYYVVKKIVESYFYDLSQLNMSENDVLVFEVDEDKNIKNKDISQSIEKEKQACRNKIYNCLDADYISQYNISINNIHEKLGDYHDVIVFIENMYFVDSNEYVTIYFVNGNIIEKEDSKKNDFSMTILTDSQNKTFKIYPNAYKYDVALGKELITNIKEITDNKYNKYSYNIIDNETYTKDLFKDFKNKLMYNLSFAYNNLNDEYKKAKFQNIETFGKYISNDKNRFITPNLTNYSVENRKDYTQYLCIDTKGNYYIFHETSPMKYTVILDTYTIDIPEFTEKYNAANEKEKVILNLNKFMLALNDKDYKYAYSVLADSFKTKNFSTPDSFENYAKSQFFDKNKFDYLEFESEADTYYTYKVKITDETNGTNVINKTFIIKLEEGTSFKISFDV